ncbi:type II toxin-antitoxin system RelE/ParE family toxin [uncultured Flavobacterium sp.]|uniref:type II toxin-antitoxin system RelE/ParE family toxin n=1 Tax=uncultured Flavobacterium sp. TaxID=165435 RepID=UPI0030C7D15B
MAYKIIVSPRAQKEIIKAINYYLERSEDAPSHFVSQLEKSYAALTVNPFFIICYKNVRSIKLRRFPYSLYFTINEKEKTVEVLSCFHNKRNPSKRP